MGTIQLSGPIYRGIDTVLALDSAQCDALAREGISWVARYLPINGLPPDVPDAQGGDHGGCWTLSALEAHRILSAGLAILPVQWGPAGGDRLCAALGQQRGQVVVAAARYLRVDPGVHLWCDYEGRRAEIAGPADGRAYLEAWSAVVTAAGYHAGLYVSLPEALSGAELYRLSGYSSYWGAAQGGLPCPVPRDYAIRQGLSTEVCGVACDPDVLRPDCLGEVPILWAP
jgi:hypothetical protein